MNEAEPVRVAVVGAMGRMGREVLRALTPQDGFEVLVAVDNQEVGRRVRDVCGTKAPDVVVQQKLGAALDETPVDVIVDFTHPSAAAGHALSAIKRGISPVIGTTGMTDMDLKEIALQSKDAGVSGIYAPNFAIGAVLMMRFSEMAAKWMPDVEVIEMHHEGKADAPSGTAMLTAQKIADGRSQATPRKHTSTMRVEGVRGGRWHDVTIHSVRLQGLIAHQAVMFGAAGETLTIRHDSLDRASFMAGVKLCVREVRKLGSFVVGMDSLLFRE